MKPKKFALILAGCGVYDGAEIHEAIMSMLAIDRQGCSYTLFAPDIDQHHVVNHRNGEEMPEKRNVLTEAARIARGKIQDLAEYRPADFDVLMLPGGFGVAKNLFTFAFDGVNARVNPTVEKAIRETHEAGKPLVALCIAPVLIAKVLGKGELTIGQDEGTRQAVEQMGATHKNTSHGEVVVDIKNKIITNPCYMLDARISDIATGAENAVKAVLDLLK